MTKAMTEVMEIEAEVLMDIYERFGVRKLINAQGTITKVGGSLMDPAVTAAMVEASHSFVEIAELLEKVGDHLARLIGVEAVLITSGAAAGLVVSTAACVTGKDPAKIFRLPDTEGLRSEVIVHRQQRNHYDSCVRQVGVHLVEIGLARETHPWELENALSERTAAVVYFPAYAGQNSLSVKQVASIAHQAGVPVIVDAAAELPPVTNLRRYIDEGADLAIFSGGKAIGGPQPSGLVLGRRDLIEACTLNASPNYAIGRPMKVGKEEIVGLAVAVERFLARDIAADLATWERQVETMIELLRDTPGIRVRRAYAEAGGRRASIVPKVYVELIPDEIGLTSDDVVGQLKRGEPKVVVGTAAGEIVLNPQTLRAGEVQTVAARLKQVVGSRAGVR